MSNRWKIGIVVALAIALLTSVVTFGVVLNAGRIQVSNFPGSFFFSAFTNWMHGFGNSGGMMGGAWPNNDLPLQEGDRLSLDEAVEVAKIYIANYWEESLEIAEVMQFNNHFYAQVAENKTGINAFEILIDPVTGAVQPEPGPNMMWNTKYGMMRGQGMMGGFRYAPSDSMAISPDQARELARVELDRTLPGTSIDEEVDVFYGYYTIHTVRNGEVSGMLSVNGETGQVWIHTWHGEFVDMTEHSHS